MATELVKGLRYNVVTKEMEEYEYEVEIVNPRIGEIQQRLQEILAELQSTDYKQWKYIDGNITEEQYAPYKELRNTLRDEYNSLEEELTTLV